MKQKPCGFVDLQVNGWRGINFSAPGLTLQDVRRVTRDLAEHGTVAYCPTVVTGPYDMYRENLAVLSAAADDPDLAPRILGIHMEGPFISPLDGARGAHPLDFVRPPSIEDFDRFQEWAGGKIVMLTLAPETRGAMDLIRHVRARGVIASLGHHLADNEALEAARQAGASAATHLGNGIPNEIHRHQNPLWWQLACDDLWGTFITDGHHIPAPFVKVALRAKTASRFVVTSDASPLAAMPPGRYDVFGLTAVINEAGRIYSEQSKGLVGSHSGMLECMNFLASLGLLDEDELWQVGFENPLALLGRPARPLSTDGVGRIVFEQGRFRVSGPAAQAG